MEANKLKGSIKVEKFELNYNIVGEEKVEIALKGKGGIFKPKDNDNKSALLKISVEAKAAEDKFSVKITTAVRYEFGEAIENYDKYVEDICLPDAINLTYGVIDDALSALKCSPLNLRKTGDEE